MVSFRVFFLRDLFTVIASAVRLPVDVVPVTISARVVRHAGHMSGSVKRCSCQIVVREDYNRHRVGMDASFTSWWKATLILFESVEFMGGSAN